MSDSRQADQRSRIFDGYSSLQNESYEFIARIIAVHNWMHDAYDTLQTHPEFSADELNAAWRPNFDRIYEHFITPFIRPYRVIMLPMIEFLNIQIESWAPGFASAGNPFDMLARTQLNLFNQAQSFFKQDPGHIDLDAVARLTPFGLMGDISDTEINGYVDAMQQFLSRFGENQFMFSKSFIQNLRKIISTLPQAYHVSRRYETLLRDTWEESMNKFTRCIKVIPAPTDFAAFFDCYRVVFAEEYDRLLRAPEFIEAQTSFIETTSEIIVCVRNANETLMDAFPTSPFVTHSQVEAVTKNVHSYKRRLDNLERKFREANANGQLTQRIDSLEQTISQFKNQLAEIETKPPKRATARKRSRARTVGTTRGISPLDISGVTDYGKDLFRNVQ